VQVLYNGDSFYLSTVTTGSKAYDAGLRPGDIITDVDGTDVTQSRFSAASLQDRINKVPPGKRVVLGVFRMSHPSFKATISGDVATASAGAMPAPSYTLKVADGVATLVITDFGSGVHRSLARDLKAAISSGAKYLVVDLSQTPGGDWKALQEAIGMFVPAGSSYGRLDVQSAEGKPYHTSSALTASGPQVVPPSVRVGVLLGGAGGTASLLFTYALFVDRQDTVIVGSGSPGIAGARTLQMPDGPGGMKVLSIVYMNNTDPEVGALPLTYGYVMSQAAAWTTKEAAFDKLMMFLKR
jgi:C-terminal processing protease CtpA/Prc